MTKTTADLQPSCTGAVYLAEEGSIDGWCVYQDRPDERATVELIVDGKVVRAMRATRLRLDRRDLGGPGDGYCGFSFPFSTAAIGDERVVLEVRERRLRSIVGRVILGGNDAARMRRLGGVNAALAKMEQVLADKRRSSTFLDCAQALGGALLHLSGRPGGKRKLGVAGLQPCLTQIGEIPALDLGWRPSPRVSLILRADGDVGELAARIRAAAAALEGFGAEFLLLDDAASALTALLPTRLRHLALVPIAPGERPHGALNAAAAAARGTFLAFARPGGPEPAGLRDALETARPGRLGIDAHLTASPASALGEWARHGLQGVVAREDFVALGGFEPARSEAESWTVLLAKAEALDLRIVPWAAPRPAGQRIRLSR